MPRGTFLRVLLTSAPSFVAACDDGLRAPSRVDDLRVLAVRASPPEVAPGARVHLDALVVGPRDVDVAAVRYTWRACVLPFRGDPTGGFDGFAIPGAEAIGADELAAEGRTCAAEIARGAPHALELGHAPTAELVVSADLLDGDEVLRHVYALEGSIAPDTRALLAGVAGVGYRIELDVEADEREPIRIVKVVTISSPSPVSGDSRNVAPPAPRLTVDGGSGEVSSGACTADGSLARARRLSVEVAPDGSGATAERYAVLLPASVDGSAYTVELRDETWFYAFFATHGALSPDATKHVPSAGLIARATWTLGADDVGPIDLWVVARDGRGGVAWCHSALW